MTLPAPAYQDDYVTLYLGDCKDILWDLPPHFAHAIVTDPPYPITANIMSWQQAIDKRNVISDIHDNEFGAGFDFELLNDFNYRLVKPNMLFFCNQIQLWDYMKYQRKNDLNFKILEWHKPGSFPVSNLYLFDTEFIFHMWKGIGSNGNKALNTYFVEPTVKGINHPTPKPERIVSALIGQITNKDEIIIEPYLGSGTTAVCAKRLGRKCIGIEINEKYMEIAIDRVKHTTANQIQFGMFGLFNENQNEQV